MTYSVAAVCRRTGQFGMAVTTSSIAVGSRVPFAKPGVGAVLTQHQTDPRLGPRGIALLEEGKTAAETIAALTADDPHIGRRQLAVVDRTGATAFFHGEHIRSIHGAAEGDGVIAIGNILRTADLPARMIDGFDARPDQPLAERLMAALEAGKAAGGELKQEKSAVLVVVDKETFPLVDLRVDYDPHAIDVLRFLWETYQPMVEMYVARAVSPDDPIAGLSPVPSPAR